MTLSYNKKYKICVKTDHGNFSFLMSRRHAHYRSYKNPPTPDLATFHLTGHQTFPTHPWKWKHPNRSSLVTKSSNDRQISPETSSSPDMSHNFPTWTETCGSDLPVQWLADKHCEDAVTGGGSPQCYRGCLVHCGSSFLSNVWWTCRQSIFSESKVVCGEQDDISKSWEERVIWTPTWNFLCDAINELWKYFFH